MPPFYEAIKYLCVCIMPPSSSLFFWKPFQNNNILLVFLIFPVCGRLLDSVETVEELLFRGVEFRFRHPPRLQHHVEFAQLCSDPVGFPDLFLKGGVADLIKDPEKSLEGGSQNVIHDKHTVLSRRQDDGS